MPQPDPWFPAPDRAFRRADALAGGLTADQVRQRVRSGRWVTVRRGWYVPAGLELTPELRAAVALGRHASGAVASHLTAAQLHGLPLLRPPGTGVWLTSSARGSAVARRGVVVAAASLTDAEVVEVGGLPCTSLARTAVDVARRWPLADAVTVLDAALRAGLTRDELREALLRADWWPGAGRARRAVALADARSESPLESLSRVRLHQQRLPAPDRQVEVRLRDGRRRYGDFGWLDHAVIGEADGRTKYLDLAVVEAEKRRQADLEEVGLVVVRWGWAEIDRRPAQVAGRLRAAFHRGRALRAAGLTRA